jgi:hypothetical protein
VRSSDRWNTYRLGARHAFSPGSVVLASGMYRDAEFRESQAEQEAIGGELQHLYRLRFAHVVSGIGYFDVSRFMSVRHGNGYVYGHLDLPRRLTLTMGVSADVVRSTASGDADQVNPKLGITWSPLPGTTLRAAAFRNVKRTLISDQTLEPTQVAGFNQFFDDANVTKSWRYGVGVDQKISRNLFSGVEGTRRDLTVPFFAPLALVDPDAPPDPTTDPTREVRRTADWKEYLARAYAFWTPHTSVALRAEYFFERLIRGGQLVGGARSVNTHRVPLGAALFHRSGLGASATATYFNQSGSFGEPLVGVLPRSGSDQFWLVDAALSWRLPRRHGFFSVGATNVIDRDFSLFENTGIDIINPTVRPGRVAYARVTLVGP